MLAPTRPRSMQSKYRLLYLGSDLELVAALRKVLTKPGYLLVTCSDDESAFIFLKSDIPYHLLLIDFEWRGRDGLKLARLARSLKHRKRMPTVFVTGTELSRRLKALVRKTGVNECVKKTPDMGGVAEAIERMLGSQPPIKAAASG